MALVLKDRVKVLATTTGTGTFTLGAAVTGYQDFSVIGDGNTTYYTIAAQASPDWEVGIGTYTASGTLLSRDTILESSNGGAAVDFPAGTKDVFVTYPAERATYLDTAGSYPVQNTFNTLNASNAVLTAGTVATTPVSATDIANKSYVDTIAAAGINYHSPVRVESPTPLNATYNNGTAGVGATLTNAGTQVALVIDGVTVAVNDRVLVYTQTNATQNGVYVVTNTGSGSTNWVLTRSSDADTYAPNSPTALGQGDGFYVTAGNTGAGELYVCNTPGTITFGTTNITFTQISSAQIYSAGTGLTLSGTTFSITDTGTAGTYGNASTVPVITTNAQGQVTSVTDTAIAIASGAVSGLAASATTDTTNASNITSGTLGTSRLSGSYTGITGVGTLSAGTWNGSTIGATYGGTGLSSFAAGDLIYADSSTTLARLADTAVGNALISGGASADPSWGKIGLATHVDGILPIANGGTGNATNQSASVANSATFNDGGSGAASGSTFNGSSPLTISYNTIGAYPTTNPAGYTSNTGTVTSVGGTGTVNGLTLTGTVTTSGNLTLGGTLSGIANSALTNSSITINGSAVSLGGSTTVTANTPNALTFNNGGAGGASGTTYNGGSAITVSYNTVGAPSTTGTNASGTWGINISGNAATSTSLSGGSVSATWVNTTQGLTDTSGTNSALRIASPGGASYTGDPVTGAIKITLPQSWTNTMLRMTIRVYTYDNGSFDIYCGGYNYQPSSAWINTFAYMDSQSRGALNVRFGHDGTNCCIYIGETSTSWSYPKIYVTDFQAGHSNYAASQWRSGWSVSVVTSLGTITETQVASKTITGQANSATITASTTAGAASTIVQRDGNGYIFNNYFNSTDNSVAGSVTAVMVKQGDNYLRSGTAAAIASFISGQSMNIAGNATTVGSVGIANIVSGNNGAAASDTISNMNDLAQKSGFYLYNNPSNAPEATWNTWMTAMGHYPGDRYGWQITQAYWSDALWTRRLTNNTWQAWRKILDSGNYNSYAPTLTGGGAYGTWGINVTGSAGGVAWGNVSSKPANIMFYEGFTLDANTMSTNATGFTYSVNAPYTGPIIRISTGGGYDLQFNATYGGVRLAYRARNGDVGSWYPWSVVTTYGSYAGGDLYAARFYDGENSAYYCDPNGRSIFASLRLNTNEWMTDSLGFNRIYFTQGDGTQIRGYSGTWYIQMGSTSTTTTIVEGAGNFYTTGAVTAYWSDKRLKKNIEKINDWREILSKINGYRFEWNDLGLKILGDSGDQERGIKVGVIAQEAKEALPQSAVVQLMQYENKVDGVLIPKKDIDYDPENPYLTVQLEKYIPVLIEASKGLMDENEQLKATIQSLVGRVIALEQKGI